MRILTVRLAWLYDNEANPLVPAATKRRDRLSDLGFDVPKIEDVEMQQGFNIGMTDEQFVNLSMTGEEKDMSIVASVILE